MDDRARIAFSMGLGALLGGFAGFLLFTERGRAFRRELEPQLEEFFGEAQRLTAAFDKTRRAVKDGLASMNPGEGGQGQGQAQGQDKGQAQGDWSH